MRTVQWFCLVLLAPSLLPAEAVFEIDPATFPLYWQDDLLPQVTAVVMQHSNNQIHELSAAVSGPYGPSDLYYATFQADEIIDMSGSFLELSLSIGCNDELQEYTNTYEPFQVFYFPGMGWPVDIAFPIDPLELCTPYPLEVDVSVFGGHTYALFSNHTGGTWNEAKRIAHALDAQVVSIGNETENRFVQTLLQDLPAWIGLSREEDEADWTWSDNTELSYSNWAAGYPDPQDANALHVLMGLDGNWTNTDSLGSGNPAHVLLEWPFEWDIEWDIVIDDLGISWHGQYLTLTWTVPADVAPGQVFDVHFSRDPYFEPSAATCIGATTGTEFSVPMAEVAGSRGWFKLVAASRDARQE